MLLTTSPDSSFPVSRRLNSQRYSVLLLPLPRTMYGSLVNTQPSGSPSANGARCMEYFAQRAEWIAWGREQDHRTSRGLVVRIIRTKTSIESCVSPPYTDARSSPRSAPGHNSFRAAAPNITPNRDIPQGLKRQPSR